MSWTQFMKETNHRIGTLQREIPDTMKGFGMMSAAAKTNGALSEKTKEFIALGIAVSTRCDSCIGFHVKSLVRLGATREEVAETISVAMYMGGGPAFMYGARALEAYDQFDC